MVMNFDLPSTHKVPEYTELKVQLDGITKAIDTEKNIEKKVELSQQMYEVIQSYIEDHGGHLNDDFQGTLQNIAKKYSKVIVRRERPEAFLKALDEGRMLVSFNPDAHGGAAYPNAGMLGQDLSGLTIPYTRGFGDIGGGSIVLITGVIPGKDLTVMDIPNNSYPYYRGKDRNQVKMIEGKIGIKDLKFVIMRVPRKYFPEENLSEFEEDHEQLKMISRIFTF